MKLPEYQTKQIKKQIKIKIILSFLENIVLLDRLNHCCLYFGRRDREIKVLGGDLLYF